MRDDAPTSVTKLFKRAQADGTLPSSVDVGHLAELAQSLVTEGVRQWAAGSCGERSMAEVVGDDIARLLAGCSAQ